ncbi:hypothetical protein V1478_013672 [Vespula squamosa]|uniref:Uncharacterized protein n=1 Tax=Vespula squamosa TaxID=30214 RepID=A0ABD2A5T2_VESSQ
MFCIYSQEQDFFFKTLIHTLITSKTYVHTSSPILLSLQIHSYASERLESCILNKLVISLIQNFLEPEKIFCIVYTLFAYYNKYKSNIYNQCLNNIFIDSTFILE